MAKFSTFESNNSLEGLKWSVEKRLNVLEELYQRYWLLNPYPFKPLVKSFNSFKEYEHWKKKQKNPWYR
ncbi:MAG: hypothetical protein HYU97_02785 [Deltaproteobacteria bacterium]|nr:hypothetical protein [Deltaproteobacteria bacterium]